MVTDMDGNEIKVGDTVKVYGLIGVKNKRETDLVGEGEIYSLSGMHGNPDRAMVWTRGISSCYHPHATQLTKESK